MDAWLWSPALDNLEEIDFILPPASTLRFLATLRVAALRKCHIPDGLAQSLQLPQLKELALEEVTISEGLTARLDLQLPRLAQS